MSKNYAKSNYKKKKQYENDFKMSNIYIRYNRIYYGYFIPKFIII